MYNTIDNSEKHQAMLAARYLSGERRMGPGALSLWNGSVMRFRKAIIR